MGCQIPANLDWSARYPSGRPISLRMMLVFHGPASCCFSSGVIRISQVASSYPSSASNWVAANGICWFVLLSKLARSSMSLYPISLFDSCILASCITLAYVFLHDVSLRKVFLGSSEFDAEQGLSFFCYFFFDIISINLDRVLPYFSLLL